MRPWDAQSCRPKGRCFPFTHSRKITVKGSFILGDSNWKLFQVGYPVDTHTDMNFLLLVTHRPAFAQLILGRWKERSLRMKHPSLPILQGIYPDRPKDSEIHFDTLAPSAKIKIKKGEKPPSQEALQKTKGKSTEEENVHTNPHQEWTLNKCRRRKRRRENKKKKKKEKKKKRMDMVNTEKRKEKQEVQLLNYQQIPLPCLRNKTKAKQKINDNNREKSKNRKVNRNSSGLCTF